MSSPRLDRAHHAAQFKKLLMPVHFCHFWVDTSVHLTPIETEWNSHVLSLDCVSSMTVSNLILTTLPWDRYYHPRSAREETEAQGSRMSTQTCLERKPSPCTAFSSVPTVPFPPPVWTSLRSACWWGSSMPHHQNFLKWENSRHWWF